MKRIRSWIVSPASTWPPWELMNTVMPASASTSSARSWLETVAASRWVISPLMTMVRARSRRSATGSYPATGRLSDSDSYGMGKVSWWRSRACAAVRPSSAEPVRHRWFDEAHLVGRDEAESLVQAAALVRRVQDETVKPLGRGPVQHVAHQCLSHPLPSPGRLGVHVDDDRMPPESDRDASVRERLGMRPHQPALHPGPADHGVVIPRHGQPADIFPMREHLGQAPLRGDAKRLEGLGGNRPRSANMLARCPAMTAASAVVATRTRRPALERS